jgi:hypothetical protein
MQDDNFKPHTQSTWQQGADAFRAGVPCSANPYETQDFNNHDRLLDMNAWHNGWNAARSNYSWAEKAS